MAGPIAVLLPPNTQRWLSMDLVQSLLLTSLGGVIAGLGTWLGARLQHKEAGRVRKEQYDREDSYRLHSDRVKAYCDLYLAAGKIRSALTWESATQEIVRQARNAYWAEFAKVSLLGENVVVGAAEEILQYVDGVIEKSQAFDSDGFRRLAKGFLAAARLDLVGFRDSSLPQGADVVTRKASVEESSA
jgi:hypothetical protein